MSVQFIQGLTKLTNTAMNGNPKKLVSLSYISKFGKYTGAAAILICAAGLIITGLNDMFGSGDSNNRNDNNYKPPRKGGMIHGNGRVR